MREYFFYLKTHSLFPVSLSSSVVEESPGRVDEDLVPPPVAAPEEEAAVGAEAVHGLGKKYLKTGEI